MSSLIDKALRALLTDPVTGARLSTVECVSLAYGLVVAIAVILAMIVLALGLGGGQ